MKLKAISAVLAVMQGVSYAAPAAQAVPAGVVTGDPTGLVGKDITYQTLQKKDGSSDILYGSDHYFCGGSMHEELGTGVVINSPRKGTRTICETSIGRKTIALSRKGKSHKSEAVLDAIEINVPKGYQFTTLNCTGAKMAISKTGGHGPLLTKHMQAWDVVNFKFVPVANLKAVKCENEI